MTGKRSMWISLIMMGVIGTYWQTAFGADGSDGGIIAVRSIGTLWQWVMVRGGNITMVTLSAMSVLMLAFVLYFIAVLRVGQIAPRPLLRELMEKIKAGDMGEARRACEYRPCPLSSVALIAIDYAHNVPDTDAVLLKDVIEGEGSRQAEAIQGQTQFLLDIAVIAPMIGLLGTVFGMLRAFRAVQDIASAKPVLLAEGITLALQTTAFGLMIGIPAMIFYAYFRRLASKQISYLEAAATDVMTALLGKKRHENSEA
ncbi:MAG: MotA/TolQ/ExbB proton channel family protein [Lentisphaerae bacterium]|nr:MotA/TolQ/ExbB proton channel family protein [Lentisphaerota bacterium]